MNRRKGVAASGSLLATSLLFSLVMACDSQTTEPEAQPAEREAQPTGDIDELADASAASPTRDLAQLERELADNETKLRQLGVTIVATIADGEAEPAKDETIVTEAAKPSPAPGGSRNMTRGKDRKTTSKAGGDKKAKQDDDAGAGTAPSGQTSTGAASDSIAGGSKSATEGKTAWNGDVAPDPAKSIQNPPTTDRPTEQAEEERCPLICSLADSTCELTDEICELADRHTDDDAYSFACERASNDCQQAREACLECLD